MGWKRADTSFLVKNEGKTCDGWKVRQNATAWNEQNEDRDFAT